MNNFGEFNDLIVIQQKTEENHGNGGQIDRMSMITQSKAPDQQQHNIKNKLIDMEKQEDVLSVMDNESVFVEHMPPRDDAAGAANAAAEGKGTRMNFQFGVEQAVVYWNDRAHFVFSDKTSLILHPGGDCFTYFKSNGQKVR